MIDRETWIILAERLEQIRLARGARVEQPEVKLKFDEHDQARVVPA